MKDVDTQWSDWAEKVKAKRRAFDQSLTDNEKSLLVKLAKETKQDSWFSINKNGKFFDKSRGCNDTFYMATSLLVNGVTPNVYTNLTKAEKDVYNKLIDKI